jgi:hypothetical protein
MEFNFGYRRTAHSRVAHIALWGGQRPRTRRLGRRPRRWDGMWRRRSAFLPESVLRCAAPLPAFQQPVAPAFVAQWAAWAELRAVAQSRPIVIHF